jgi:hypothetical protein
MHWNGKENKAGVLFPRRLKGDHKRNTTDKLPRPFLFALKKKYERYLWMTITRWVSYGVDV